VRRLQALVLVAAATVVWGTTFSLVKAALADSGPLTFLAWRFALAAVLVLALARGRTRLRPTRSSVLCGVALFCGFAFQTAGLATTTPARSAFITALSAVLVPLAEPLFGVNRFSVRVMGGGLLALAGLAVLLRPGTQQITVGDIFTFGCAIAFAAHIVVLQVAVRETPAAQVNALQVLVPAALALPAAALEQWTFTPSLRLAVALVVTSGLATVAAFWALTAAQRALSAAECSVILAFEPVAAAAVSVALGLDTAGPELVVGGSLVVGGVVLATAQGTPRPHL
jgi:drug/metabolite transporter (DMT)-like permease